MGDLNASPPYVTSTDWKTNRLKNDPKCHWIIEGTSSIGGSVTIDPMAEMSNT
jgi:hypothetical protein